MPTVYRFKSYDIKSDEYVTSRRMGTREAIALAGGTLIEDAAREVADSELGREHAGMTDRDYWWKVASSERLAVMR